jgi:hypothetical protein
MPGSAWIAGLRVMVPRLGSGDAAELHEPLIVEV